MSTEERLATAKTHKDAGNAAFKAKNLTEAIVQYEEVRWWLLPWDLLAVKLARLFQAERFIRGLNAPEGEVAEVGFQRYCYKIYRQ